MSPPIASTKPSRPRGRAHAVAAAGVAESLEREEDPVAIARRHARPTVDDADVDGVSRHARGDAHGLVGRAW